MSLQTKLDETISNAEKVLANFPAQLFKKYAEDFADFCSKEVRNCPYWEVKMSEYDDKEAGISCTLAHTFEERYYPSRGETIIVNYRAVIEVNISESTIEIQYSGQMPMPKVTAVFKRSPGTTLETSPNLLNKAARLLSYLYSL